MINETDHLFKYLLAILTLFFIGKTNAHRFYYDGHHILIDS